jgi:hypothetical protein
MQVTNNKQLKISNISQQTCLIPINVAKAAIQGANAVQAVQAVAAANAASGNQQVYLKICFFFLKISLSYL